MPRALILGGTGLIGRAVAARLLAAGWRVDVTGRDPAHMPPETAAAGARFIAADRADGGRLRACLGGRRPPAPRLRLLLLAHRGGGVVHPTAAANIAALVETVAGKPGSRILNCADPDTPSALEISRVIARRLGHAWEEVLLDETAPDTLGRTPWDAPHPVVLDMSAAEDLGYRPAGDYAATVAAEIDWLLDAARSGGISPDDPYFGPFFDYAAEDAFLAGHTP